MAERPGLPLLAWSEAQGSPAGAGRRYLRCLGALGVAAMIAAVVATLVWTPRPLLVWNASPSSPLGLYLVSEATGARPGEMVIAWPPEEARVLGAERHYLPRNVPMVKRVVAAAGDRVCAVGEAVSVNDRLEVLRRSADLSDRPLPWWTGCVTLSDSDLFLLNSGIPNAFDGRYFGVTPSNLVVGRARLIWPG